MNEYIFDLYQKMTDPYFDGYTGWAAKQKLYSMNKEIEQILSQPNIPKYVGEEEWLKEKGI